MQNDHGMLMRAAAEHDINHVTLGHAVTLIEANMEPGLAQETISLIHAAISPGHAVLRAHRAAEPAQATAESPEVVVEVDPGDAGAAMARLVHGDDVKTVRRTKPKTAGKTAPKAKPEPKPAPAKASRKIAPKT